MKATITYHFNRKWVDKNRYIISIHLLQENREGKFAWLNNKGEKNTKMLVAQVLFFSFENQIQIFEPKMLQTLLSLIPSPCTGFLLCLEMCLWKKINYIFFWIYILTMILIDQYFYFKYLDRFCCLTKMLSNKEPTGWIFLPL